MLPTYSISPFLGHDNEMKYDNLARSLSMMEDELKRADERVKNAEARVVVIEDELAAIGENQKQLEVRNVLPTLDKNFRPGLS
jgi:hypothetical protein